MVIYLFHTIAQLPFKGSNLEGYWSEDNKGVRYYVVKSYGWYPIYIYKNNMWYEISDRYSSSTGRQVSNSNPIEWNEDLYEKVFLVTANEMKMLERNATHQDIVNNKRKPPTIASRGLLYLSKIDYAPLSPRRPRTMTRPYISGLTIFLA